MRLWGCGGAVLATFMVLGCIAEDATVLERQGTASAAPEVATAVFELIALDFGGTSIKLCGHREQPVSIGLACESTVPASSSPVVKDGCPCFDFAMDGTLQLPDGGVSSPSVAIAGLCSSYLRVASDWIFDYTLYAGQSCTGAVITGTGVNCYDTGDILTKAHPNQSVEALHSGINPNTVACIAVTDGGVGAQVNCCVRNEAGCRETTQDDRLHCGTCGRACARDQVCIAGGCVSATNYVQAPSTAGYIDACAASGHSEYSPNDDDTIASFELPFDFSLRGSLSPAGTEVRVSTNGWVEVPRFTGFIAAHFGDTFGGDPNICVAVVGREPERQLVVEWRDQRYFPPESFPDTHLTYELIWSESDYSIDVVFERMEAGRAEPFYIDGATRRVGGCPDGGLECLPESGYRTRWRPSP